MHSRSRNKYSPDDRPAGARESSTGLEMENSNDGQRKIFRAKKTMPLSCRKQVNLLMRIKESKSKGLQKPEGGNAMAKPSPGNAMAKPSPGNDMKKPPRMPVLEKEVVCAQSSGSEPEENAGQDTQVCISDVEKMIDLTTDDNDDQLGKTGHQFWHLFTRGDPVSPTRTLPPLPETAVPPDLPAVAASFNMPQKPELKVAKIENPKAVGILWDLSQIDTSVASIQSYCLYVLHENANVRKLRWRSMGVIKAIQLPMCCRLTKLNPGRYHFAVVGKDIYGRYGPYSDILSTTVSAVDC
ncbi:UNVERIFIED_CONTAM: hypothetical protein FKN15_058051 [Acipenser sinensis]